MPSSKNPVSYLDLETFFMFNIYGHAVHVGGWVCVLYRAKYRSDKTGLKSWRRIEAGRIFRYARPLLRRGQSRNISRLYEFRGGRPGYGYLSGLPLPTFPSPESIFEMICKEKKKIGALIKGRWRWEKKKESGNAIITLFDGWSYLNEWELNQLWNIWVKEREKSYLSEGQKKISFSKHEYNKISVYLFSSFLFVKKDSWRRRVGVCVSFLKNDPPNLFFCFEFQTTVTVFVVVVCAAQILGSD